MTDCQIEREIALELSRKERRKARYERDKERILAQKKEYYKRVKEAKAEYAKQYYAKTAEAQKEYQRKRRASRVGKDSRAIRYANDADYRAKIVESARKWRETNKAHAQRLKVEHSQNPAVTLWKTARNRARKSGVDFDLELSDVVVPSTCPILGIPLFVKSGKVGPNSPSLDRIYPDRGYTKGNVQVISYKANTMKNNATPRDLLNFAYWATSSFGMHGSMQKEEMELRRTTGQGI